MTNSKDKHFIETTLMDGRFFRISPSDKLGKRKVMFHQRRDKIQHDYYLLLILKCLGINLLPRKHSKNLLSNLTSLLFPVLFHLIYIDCVLSNISYMMRLAEDNLFLASIVNLTTILMLWYVLMCKKKQLKKFLACFNNSMYDTPWRKTRRFSFTNILSMFLCVLPFGYGIAALYLSHPMQKLLIYFWEFEKINTAISIVFYLREVGSSLLNHSFVGVVSVLYASSCYKIVKAVTNSRMVLEKALSDSNPQNISTSFLLAYLKNLDNVENLEDVFTSPAFILTLSNGLSLFTLMAISFASKSFLSGYAILQIVMYLITSGVYLVSNIVMASQIPLEVEKNVKYFTKLHEKYILESPYFNLDENQLVLIKGAVERRIIYLSGCHIVYFTRHVLISIIGALITYGLLVMQMQTK